ncbi:MAG: (2Fe-2S)-binding protein [Alphaproteobacteria bacterium]|nr:(2Fe-2S)-binding protein [Rhodospirillales bacterium]MCW9045105.1 (2Fe-2S)-binding protein [Alphaproteobacteria bacterium]
MLRFKVNGKERQVDVEEDTPLLWVLRDNLGLPGTKFGCGVSECGACTVHVDGEAVRSCSFPVSDAAGKNITTIEGLDPESKHPLQEAWVKHEVPQCGYCQSGMIMSAAALLKENPSPTDEQINEEVTNVCRCGTYSRVRAAIHTAAGNEKGGA